MNPASVAVDRRRGDRAPAWPTTSPRRGWRDVVILDRGARPGRGKHRPGDRRLPRAVRHGRSTSGSRCSRARSSAGSRRRPASTRDTRRPAISGSAPSEAELDALRAGQAVQHAEGLTEAVEVGRGRHRADQSGAAPGRSGRRRLLSHRRLHPAARRCWRATSPRRARLGVRVHWGVEVDRAFAAAGRHHLGGADIAGTDRRWPPW